MKNTLIKDMKSENPRKRTVSIEETDHANGSWMSKKWECSYLLKDRFSSANSNEMREWVDKKKKQTLKTCDIIRKIDFRTGENKIKCIVKGAIYLIYRMTAFQVLFVNEVTVNLGEKHQIQKYTNKITRGKSENS